MNKRWSLAASKRHEMDLEKTYLRGMEVLCEAETAAKWAEATAQARGRLHFCRRWGLTSCTNKEPLLALAHLC